MPNDDFPQRRADAVLEVGSLARGLRILVEISSARGGLSLAELARACEIPKPTAHRLAKVLMQRGFLRVDEITADYVLGFRFFDFGLSMGFIEDIRSVARPVLLDLSEKVHHLCSLALMDVPDVLTLLRASSTSAPKVGGAVGGRMPLHSTGAGKAMLAKLPEDRRTELINSLTLTRRTYKTIVTQRELKREISQVEADGFGLADEENDVGIRSIAAALQPTSHGCTLAIAITVPSFAVSKSELHTFEKPLLSAAATLTSLLELESKRMF
ncbi:IclR family transcriptional regulator [Mesorhizobium sp.]|uniref:IclR family transcriptional regulator n=1 Tax=Mesorhizobium sp. TaxID=1871066 RepID=UPI0025F160F4|nr:IclR family transcriptional regulator [Mesorhizobium sp.]